MFVKACRFFFFCRMILTCNITFVTSPDNGDELIRYIRCEVIPVLFGPQSPALNPAIKKVVESGGEKLPEDHDLSIALSADFYSYEEETKWKEDFLLPTLQNFNDTYGEKALYFITLLEKV